MELAHCRQRNIPRVSLTPPRDTLPSGKEDVQHIQETVITGQVHFLTVNNDLHTLDETVDNLEGVNCCSPSFVVSESVQSLQDRLDVLLSEHFLYELDCDGLNKGNTPERIDSLVRPCLSSLVATASVEINSTIILTTISSIAGDEGICVYMSRRQRKCSMDSSKSTSAS